MVHGIAFSMSGARANHPPARPADARFWGKAGARVDSAGYLCYNIIMRACARPHAGGMQHRQDKRILR